MCFLEIKFYKQLNVFLLLVFLLLKKITHMMNVAENRQKIYVSTSVTQLYYF